MAETFSKDDFETIMSNLKSIDSGINEPETRNSLHLAGMGLHFIRANKQWADFQRFVLDSDTQVSEDQIRHLRSLDLEP